MDKLPSILSSVDLFLPPATHPTSLAAPRLFGKRNIHFHTLQDGAPQEPLGGVSRCEHLCSVAPASAPNCFQAPREERSPSVDSFCTDMWSLCSQGWLPAGTFGAAAEGPAGPGPLSQL